jgi:hypothetical protein
VPNPNAVTVDVGVNFTGVTYDAATKTFTVPAGAPRWSVPAFTQVRPGQNTITWSLTATNVPANCPAAFTPGAGIVFDATWKGGGVQPGTVNGTLQVADNFNAGGPNVDYPYVIGVTLTGPGANGGTQAFVLDPDVENEGGGGGGAAISHA